MSGTDPSQPTPESQHKFTSNEDNSLSQTNSMLSAFREPSLNPDNPAVSMQIPFIPPRRSTTGKRNDPDEVYRRMTNKKRYLIHYCLLGLSLLQISLMGILYFNWEVFIGTNVGLNSSQINYVISGFGFGFLVSVLLSSTMLRVFTRPALLLITGTGFSLFYVFFAITSMFAQFKILNFENHWVLTIVSGICMFGIGLSNGPVRVISTSTIAKMFPHKVHTMIQQMTLAIISGGFVGPCICSFMLSLKICSIEVVFIGFAIAAFILALICSSLIPASRILAKKDSVVGVLDIMMKWRGFTNILHIFIEGIIFRFQVNGISIHLNKTYNIDETEVGWLVNAIGICQAGFLFLNVILLKYMDYRRVYMLIGLFASALGQNILAGNLVQFRGDWSELEIIMKFGILRTKAPTLPQVLIGFILAQNLGSCLACENRDLTVVCQQILAEKARKRTISIGRAPTIENQRSLSVASTASSRARKAHEVPIAVKDLVATITLFTFSTSITVGSLLYANILKTNLWFSDLLSICSAILVLLIINYGFTARGFFFDPPGH